MKNNFLCVCLLAGMLIASVSSQKTMPATPGQIEVSKHPLVLEPPVGPQAPKLDMAKLRHEAAELAELAQTMPADLDQIAKGKLPKDVADKLKRIEKLSKKLRTELTP